MKVSQCSNNNPNFGMKFSFVKKSPNGDWFKAKKCFFEDVQLSVIRRKVEALKPENDEFILNLDLPTFKVEKDLENNYFLNHAYDMDVCLKKENGETTNFDLGSKDIKLKLFDIKEKLNLHPDGPFFKLWAFVDNLAKKNQNI